MVSWDRREIFKISMITLFWAAFLALFIPFYGEVLLAAVFALAIEPAFAKILQRKHFRWRTSVALILTGMFVALAVPVTIVAYKMYMYVVEISKTGLQSTPAFQKMLVLKDQIVRFANSVLSRVGLSEDIDLSGLSSDSLSQIANYAVGFLTAMAYNIPGILLSLFVFCAALYFFLAEAGPLKRVFQRQKFLSPQEASGLITVLQKASYNTVVSSVVIAAIQASMVAVGALILGSGDFVVVWVITFFCSFIPVIGAGPVALALGIGDFIMGDYGHAIGFVVVAVLAGTIDNVVRPYLIASGEEDLHPVVSLLAIIGALILFGMPGLFLGPVIATVAVKIVPTLNGDSGAQRTTASGDEPA